MKILFRVTLNTFFGIILIFIWLQFVEISQILEKLSGAKFSFLGLVFLFLFLSPAIRAIRLKLLLAPVKNVPFKELVFLNGAAMMLNFLIPIRGGEIAKGVYLGNQYQLPIGKTLVWIFLDRFLDFLLVLVLSAILLLVIGTNLPISFIQGVFLLTVVVLVMAYLMVYQPGLARRFLSLIREVLVHQGLKGLFERFYEFLLDTFEVLRRTNRHLSALFCLTVLAYMADGAIWYFSFLALGEIQPYSKMFLGQMLSALTYLIPAAPGYVGSAEASGLLILSGIFGIGPNIASAMIVMLHVATAVFVIIYGTASLFFLKMDLGLILKKILKRS